MIINISLGDIFGIVSGIVLVLSASILWYQIKRGLTTPNLTTWLVGLFVGGINAFSFYAIVEDNFAKGAIMFAGLFTLIIVFFYSLYKGKFAKPDWLDILLFSLVFAVGAVWKYTDDNRIANFYVQIVTCIANFATIQKLWTRKLHDYYLGWTIAVLAYSLCILGLLLSATKDWLVYFGPILNGVLCNGSVALLAARNNKNKKVIINNQKK
jgi:hypothetical protein